MVHCESYPRIFFSTMNGAAQRPAEPALTIIINSLHHRNSTFTAV